LGRKKRKECGEEETLRFTAGLNAGGEEGLCHGEELRRSVSNHTFRRELIEEGRNAGEEEMGRPSLCSGLNADPPLRCGSVILGVDCGVVWICKSHE